MSLRPRSRVTRVLPQFGLVLLALGTACGEGNVTRSSEIAGIALTPKNATLLVGGTLALDAQVQKPDGAAAPADVFFSSSDTTVASVTSTGVVTARKAGSANIAATALGTSAVAAIVVNNPPVASIPPLFPQTPAAVATVVVSLANTKADEGKTVQATAQLRSASGSLLSGRSVVWTTSNASVATVSSAGVVTAKKKGTVNIVATSEGKQGSAALVVQKD